MKKILFLLLLFFCTHAINAFAWYSYERAITVQSSEVSGGANLTQFPILVCANASSGACNATVSGLNQSGGGAHVQNANGYDIIFTTDSACVNQLNWEMEKYVPSTGEFEAWVSNSSTPLSYSSNTTLYMCYGNSAISSFQSTASNVWDSNYTGVLHLPNGTSLTANDTTSNADNGTINGATASSGQIDGGANFVSASSQSIQLNNPPPTVPFTFSAWAKLPAATGSNQALIGNNINNGAEEWRINTSGYQDFVDSGLTDLGASNTALSSGTWYYLTVSYDGGAIRFYLNGAPDGTVSATSSFGYYPATIGEGYNFVGGQEYFNGSLDEVRISSVLRTDGWVATEYNNQSAPSSFYSMGSESTPTVDVWQGPSGGSWSNASNWSNGIPISTSIVIFDSTDNNPSTVDSSFTGTITSLTVNGYTGTITQNKALAITGNYSQTSGTFTQNANFTVSGTYSQTGGTFTAPSPGTTSFSAYDFQIPTGTGTLYFNRFGGSGSPYIIYDVYALQAMEEELGGNFQLAGNIDASGTVNWNSGAGFVPVGNSTTVYSGNFNGGNYTISHLAINLPDTIGVGLFGEVSGTIFSVNLTVDNITGYYYTGGLVGYLDEGTISFCSVTVNSGETIYGEAGEAGGLAGLQYNGNIDDSSAIVSGTVSGNENIGGLESENLYGNIDDSYASVSGSLSVSSYGFLGGFVANNLGAITNSYASISGTVSGSGQSDFGGFAGTNSGGTASIANSYATGTLSVSGGTDVGGFVGANSSPISNSYSTVSVSGSSAVNGFVGLDSSGAYNNDWYYNGSSYTQPTGVTEATGYSDFYGTGSGTGGVVYQTSGSCTAWAFPSDWINQSGAYPELLISLTGDYWQGPTGGLWSNSLNWSSGVPTSSTTVIFNSSDNNASTVDSSFAGTIANLIIINYTGTITQSKALTVSSDFVQEGGTFTQGANLTVSGIFQQTGGTFSASSPGTTSFSAYDFRIPTASGTLYFNRFVGSGTSSSPYIIYDVYALQAVEEVAETYNYFQIAGSISASGTANWNSGSGFMPIGNNTVSTYFEGYFDGGGYAISHLTMDLPDESFIGLFGAFYGGSVSNVNLTVDNITGYEEVGGLVGYMDTTVAIFGCSVTINPSGTVSGGSSYIGGLVGRSLNAIISNSYVNIEGTVSETGSGDGVGGVVGYNGSFASIDNSYATGTVSGTGTDVGGLVGENNNNSSISNSYATTSVSGSSTVNGFVGYDDGTGVFNNDWYYNGSAYTQPTGVTEATGYSDFYSTGSGTGGAVYKTSGSCDAWDFTFPWLSQTSAYPIFASLASWDVWQGTSGGNWSNSSNWSSGVPISTTNVLFNGTDTNNSTIDTGFSGPIANLYISNTYAGTITQSQALTVTGGYTQSSGAFIQNANLTVSGVFWQIGGTFAASSPSTVSFSANDFRIPTTLGTLNFNRFVGSGTNSSPYIIYDVYALQAVEELALSGDYFQIGEAIDASGTVNWNGGSGFQPIGTAGGDFVGYFNGEDYTISHLSINLPNSSNVGLFSFISAGSISNLNLTVDNITGYQNVGGLAGGLAGTTIIGCAVTINSGKTVSGSGGAVGGLVGYINGRDFISNSYVTISGTVSGSGNYIGGFVGENTGATAAALIISNSYVTGTVSGTGTDVGGFAGYNNTGTISNSYATVTVSGSSTVNGFVGLDSSGAYTNDWYYNGSAYTQPTGVTEAAGYSDFYGTGGGTGGAVYLLSGTCLAWSFPGVWTSQTSAYPVLTLLNSSWDVWQGSVGGNWSNGSNWSSGVPGSTTNVLFNATDNNASTIDSGFSGSVANLFINGYTGTITQSTNLTIVGGFTQLSGIFTCANPSTYSFTAGQNFTIPSAAGSFMRYTGSGPYSIYDVYGLQAMDEGLSSSYILANNIDASLTVNWNGGSGFVPIGSNNGVFAGSFNGEGYTISHLAIDLPDRNFVGLFGDINAPISNLNLTVDNITGENDVGGLSGYFSNNSSSASGCSVTINPGKTVSGNQNVGGFLGYRNRGSISNSYASGAVSASSIYSGGFVGYNASGAGSIADSYATGSVSSSANDVGGFAGNNSGTITNSFATVSVSGVGAAVKGFAGVYSGGSYTNDWYYNGSAYTEPAHVTEASGYSDFYGTGSGTGGAVYLTSGTCTAWSFPGTWTSQANANPILSSLASSTNQSTRAFFSFN